MTRPSHRNDDQEEERNYEADNEERRRIQVQHGQHANLRSLGSVSAVTTMAPHLRVDSPSRYTGGAGGGGGAVSFVGWTQRMMRRTAPANGIRRKNIQPHG